MHRGGCAPALALKPHYSVSLRLPLVPAEPPSLGLAQGRALQGPVCSLCLRADESLLMFPSEAKAPALALSWRLGGLHRGAGPCFPAAPPGRGASPFGESARPASLRVASACP